MIALELSEAHIRADVSGIRAEVPAEAAELAQAVTGLVRMDRCRLAGSDPLAPATARRSDNQTSETLQIAIQTDAAINPGNSGGAGVLSWPGRTGPEGT